MYRYQLSRGTIVRNGENVPVFLIQDHIGKSYELSEKLVRALMAMVETPELKMIVLSGEDG